MNPLNIGSSIAEEIMNYFNEEQYRAWKERNYQVRPSVAEQFEAVTDKPEIIVIGDYDVDGIMSVKMMVSLLKRLHPYSKVSYIVPRRFSDGYGISAHITEAICSEFIPQNTCIVTVDNGISQFAALGRLFEAGFSVVLTDHHMPQVNEDGTLKLPLADCILNPHIKDQKHSDDFSFEHYCGAGVVYKLAQALLIEEEVIQKEFLPYAAIATIADVVPLIEDNWILVHNLLEKIGELMPEELNFTVKPSVYLDEGDIAFQICPVLNAAGRLLDAGAEQVLSYLFAPTEEKRCELLDLNQQRKELTEEQVNRVLEYISEHALVEMEPICVNLPGLHHGLIGIIAGKVCEKFGRACMICSDGKGSGRTPKGFDIFQYGTSHIELFNKFGGHKGACGFSIADSDFEKLAAYSMPTKVEKRHCYDIYLEKEQIAEFYRKTKQFRPFGEGNPAPKCMVKIRLGDKINYMGKDNPIHLSMKNGDGSKIVHFYHRDPDTWNSNLSDEHCFNGIGTVNLNFFRGQTTPQLNIEEVYDPEDEPLDFRRI